MGNLYEKLQSSPVIAAVKEDSMLQSAIDSPCDVLFLLRGNICEIDQVVQRVRAAGKEIYIHIDLLDGFGRDRYSLMYVQDRVRPHGIITTNSNLVKTAKKLDLFVIQRMFMIDNISLITGIQTLQTVKPNAVEILPGIMPRVTQEICKQVQVPVITGGLVSEKEDVIRSLSAGAVGVSTTNPSMWDI